MNKRLETDVELLTRIICTYGKRVLLMSEVSGEALDEYAARLKLRREMVQ